MGHPEIELSDADLEGMDEIKAAAEATEKLRRALGQPRWRESEKPDTEPESTHPGR